MNSFARMATDRATTKRNPAAVGGKVNAPVAHLAELAIVPIMPVTPQIAEYYRLNSPRETYVTYAEGTPDVLEGDILTTGGTSYRVQSVAPWRTHNAFIEIIVQQVKGT